MVFNTKNLYKEHNRSDEHLDLDEKMRAKFGLQNSAVIFCRMCGKTANLKSIL